MSDARPNYQLIVDVLDFTPPDGDDTLMTLSSAQLLPILRRPLRRPCPRSCGKTPCAAS